MQFGKVLPLSALLPVVCACSTGVGNFEQPSLNEPHATLMFSRDSGGSISRQFVPVFKYYDNPECNDHGQPSGLAGLAFDAPREVSVRIPSRSAAFLQGATITVDTTYVPTGPTSKLSNCITLTSFMPQSGASYAVRHIRTADGCALEIKNTSTGQRPPDAVNLPLTAWCHYLTREPTGGDNATPPPPPVAGSL